MKRARETWTSEPDGHGRISVDLTNAQKAEIHAAMIGEGIKSMSDYLRFAALKRARGEK